MRQFIFTIIFCASLLVFAAVDARASLLGSTIFLSHRFPDLDSSVESFPVTVEPGTGDSQLFGLLYRANPEDNRLLINFIRPFSFENDAFNGHVAEFIPDPIQGVTVDTNMSGWDDSRLAFDQNSFRINWAGLSAQQDTYFYASIKFPNDGPVNAAIPEPATFILFALGMGAAFSSRFFRKS